MKNTKYLTFTLGFIFLLFAMACTEKIDPVVEDLEFDRIFTPLDISAEITNQTTVTLNWKLSAGADSYELEISDDNLLFANIIHTATVAANDLPYVYDLPAGDAQFSARVKAISSASGVEDSKWTTLAFRSLPENLFEGYSIKMTALGTVNIKWKPGKAVTGLLFVSGSGETSEAISAAELAAGEKTVSGLDNADYEIRLMNASAVRGTQNFTVEGTVLLAAGADLAAAIGAAAAGDVIVLTSNETYGFAGDIMLTQSIKIRGLNADGKPVIYTTSGDHMFSIDAGLTTADSLVFEYLTISGYVNYDDAQGRIRGVFDQQPDDGCNLGLIKFNSCEIQNFDRHLIRLRGTGAIQTIQNIVVNDCVLNDFAWGSAYGVIHSNKVESTINNIKISNTTVYNTRRGLIYYQNGPSCESIVVENCTFNRLAYDDGSSRYFMDYNGTVFTGSGIQINNCILGESQAGYTQGIRTDGTLSINNSYATSDFDDSAGYSILSLLIPYGGSSTALWKDPVNGDFSFLSPLGASAGDPRWE
ncbi:MAG: DUF5123 domain-containing protein [Bacteroidales bacterium]|nr:DUF5123 domain-containing protein [Bacteroidales bacterium]